MNDWLKHLGLALRAGFIVLGEDMIVESIRNKKAELVIVAVDASDNTRKKFTDKCDFYGVQLICAGTKEELSHALSKHNPAAAAVCDKGFALGLLAKLKK